MATQDSSGIAAPFSQIPCDQNRLGAQEFLALVDRIKKINDATCDRLGESLDGRDYKAISKEIESVFLAHMSEGNGPLRDGFLRAMTYFMSVTADGCTPIAGWNPLHCTAMAFSGEGVAE